MLLVSWAFGLVSWLIWTRRDSEATRVNLAGGLCACLGLSQIAFFQSRDVSLDPSAFRWLLALNYAGSQCVMFAGLSLAIVLPRPLVRFRSWRILVWIPWIACAAQAVLHASRILSNPLWTTYAAGNICMALASTLFACRFILEKDALLRSQLKWVALSFVFGLLPLTLLTEIPLVLGKHPLVAEKWSILATGLIPLGFAFAITKFRLLDVGTLVDGFLTNLVVLLALAGLEACFWIQAGTALPVDPTLRRIVFAATMLAVIFIYAPFRTWVTRLLARSSGRSRPSAAFAIEALLARSRILDDAERALEQTMSEILKPDSLRWIRRGGGRDRTLDSLAEKGGCLGQELGDVPEEEGANLWIPVVEGSRLSAIVLEPVPGRSWRRGDLELASLLARASEPLLESQGLRREREALEREIHDGLGNQLYGLMLLSRDPEDVPLDILKARMVRIQSTAQEAMDGLRTGLSVLSAPSGSFGPALGTLLLRADDNFRTVGIRFDARVEDAVAELPLEGRHAFAFLRTLQECLGNAARHSHARAVLVEIGLGIGILLCVVEDDGTGFDPSSEGHGLGLGHIRTRLLELGGSGTIESHSGRGTRVTLELPLPQNREEP